MVIMKIMFMTILITTVITFIKSVNL